MNKVIDVNDLPEFDIAQYLKTDSLIRLISTLAKLSKRVAFLNRKLRRWLWRVNCGRVEFLNQAHQT
jgi:hypothetical protein